MPSCGVFKIFIFNYLELNLHFGLDKKFPSNRLPWIQDYEMVDIADEDAPKYCSR
jgi:hypothetical protein